MSTKDDISRFWRRRHDLFTRYDDGIQMNHQQWYSVTPEAIARVTALQCRHRFPAATKVFDAFGGAGGNTIQLAMLFPQVVYNELDSESFAHAQNNAWVYGVQNNVEYHCEDFFQMDPAALDMDKSNDIVFLSPPWGGMSYLNSDVWDLDSDDHGEKVSVAQAFVHGSKFADNICMFLPKTSNLEQIARLISDDQQADIDYVHVDGKCKGMCVYTGPNLIHNDYTR